jgi:hypothetical protein
MRKKSNPDFWSGFFWFKHKLSFGIFGAARCFRRIFPAHEYGLNQGGSIGRRYRYRVGKAASANDLQPDIIILCRQQFYRCLFAAILMGYVSPSPDRYFSCP